MKKYKKDGKEQQKLNVSDKCNLEGIDYPSENDDWKKFEKNNQTNALNVLYAKKKLYILAVFQNDSNHEKQFFFNDSKW